MPECVIECTDLRMAYGPTRVLGGVDFSIGTGEVVALLGPNGAGKTTTIEILEGFRMPTGGRVRVFGQNPATADEHWRARVGVVLQSWRDHPRWQVRELLWHLGEFYRGYSTDRQQRPWDVDDLLDRVGLGEKKKRRISGLSGGERRRLDVAVGIIGRPDLLFLDEPTAGFDPQARRGFHDLIHSLADHQTTVLLTTHDLDEAERLANRILLLAGGRIIADGSPDALRRQVSGPAEVRWTQDGTTQVHATDDPADYLRGLLATDTRVEDLEVRRANLEDAYISLVHQVEVAGADETDLDLAWVAAQKGAEDD